MGPGRIRPHLKEGRNAGAHPGKKPIRGSGKTADFKPPTFRGFRNDAEIRGREEKLDPEGQDHRNQSEVGVSAVEVR